MAKKKPREESDSTQDAAAAGSDSASGPSVLVPIICSECHGEGSDFVFDTGVPSESLTCPICEHQAARPNDADLARIAEKRSKEKTAFIVSLVMALVSLASFGVWA